MIGEFELNKLLEKYGLNVEKVLNINDNILTYGEYKDIDDTLNYLIVSIIKTKGVTNVLTEQPSSLDHRGWLNSVGVHNCTLDD